MKADVIIVLGAAVWPNQQPSPSLVRRVNKSVDLYTSGHARNMIMSGGVGKYPPAEAVVMKRIALERGVPSEKIITEDQSGNTYQSAINCVSIMDENNWVNTIIVSDSYHLIRSVFLFKALGKSAEGISPDEGRGDTKLWKWVFYHFREIIALPWYAVRVAIQIFLARHWPNKKIKRTRKPRRLF